MFGRTLVVNLSKKTICEKQVNKEIQVNYLGGRGLNSYLLYRYLEKGIDPLGPKNLLLFGTGALTGTSAPASGRFTVSAKSPETGFLGDGNCGGFWAPMLRRAGYDLIIIEGRSPKPAYLLIQDGAAEICSSTETWGKDSIETQNIYKKKHPDSETVCIGQAGENLVRFACVRTGLKNAAGRTGMGAVMGSKKLKAIVVHGTKEVEARCKEELLRERAELTEKIQKRKVIQSLSKYGTPYLLNLLNAKGSLGTRNFQQSQFEGAEEISGEELNSKYSIRKTACFGCPIRCRHVYEIDGQFAEGPEFATLGCFGAKCGLDDMKTVLRANMLCNRYGLDTVTTGSLIAWVIECAEKKAIVNTDENLKLEWGNPETVLKLIEQIAFLKGIGKILAMGGLSAAQKLGSECGKRLVHIKGLPVEAVDVRWNMGFALGLATASRGGDHLRNRPTFENLNLPPEVIQKVCGFEISPDPLSCIGKPALVKWAEELYAVTDSLGICRFASLWNSPNLLGYEDLSVLFNLVAGEKMTPTDLATVGERITNIERLFNIREGLKRKDDQLPPRFFEATQNGRKSAVTRKKMDSMLSEYYKLRDWTTSGVPTKTQVKKLGLCLTSSVFE
jgi:aldehyde:ferredoxin oxidoreductase